MVAKFIGYQQLDFTSPNGEHIKGANLYVSYLDENVTGEKTEKFFVKPEIKFPEQLKIGMQMNLSFNHKGKIESITMK